ncbi:uncharacterized protein [Panulirus ornatus]|uniref:uncharacterized protein n=1 Tax=Panulirus ornatus TaxID=150431 RepID=UPI003A8BD12E
MTGGNMGSNAMQDHTHREDEDLSGWDPRLEDFLDRKSSTISSYGPGANFSRSVNLARSKEMVREPRGLYVRNVPCSVTNDSLHRMFSEHGKVLSVYIGQPRTGYLSSQITWAIIKVESMKDAMAMISALHQKPPMNLKVELAMTEEEKQKHRREKDLEKKHQEEMEGITSNRLNARDCKPSPSQFSSASGNLTNEAGRGKMLSSLSVRPKERQFMNQQQKEDVASPIKSRNGSLTPPGNSPIPNSSECHPKSQAVVEMGNGTVAVGWRQPRPCVCCGAQGQLRCSVCKAWYCGKLCQVDDWYYHREKCTPPPSLEDADCEYESGRNISYIIRQAESKDSLLLAPQIQKPKASISESSDCMPQALQPSEKEENVSKGNEQQHMQVDENKEQEVLIEKLRNQNGFYSHTNIKNHLQSSPEQSTRLFGKENTKENEIKVFNAQMTLTSKEIPDRFFEKKNLQETKSKVQNAPVIVSKENANSAQDHGIRRVSCKAIRNRTFIPSAGKLRRPHCAELSAFGDDDKNKLSKELCVSSEIFTEQENSQNTNNKCNKRDESTQTVPHTVAAGEEGTCMAKASASYTNISQESLTTSSPNSIPHLTHASPVKKDESIMSTAMKTSVPVLSSFSEKLLLDTVYEGIITSVDSYKQFTVVVKADQAESIFGEAQEVLSNVPYDPNFKPDIGCIVAALSSSDNSWYRAYVHKLIAGKYSVYYIDFGNMEMVEKTKPLPPGLFTELPGLVMIAKLHAEVDIKVQKQLQSIVMINKPITFKVRGKKSKSLKVSLLGYDPDDRVTDYILRPWYSSLPQENCKNLCTSMPNPPIGLAEEYRTLGAFIQDKKDINSVEVHRRQKSLTSQGKIKSTEFVSPSGEKASGMNSVCQVKFSNDVHNAQNYLEGSKNFLRSSGIEKVCLNAATGLESSNRGSEITKKAYPGLAKTPFDGHFLFDSRTMNDTLEVSKKEGSMKCQRLSEIKGISSCSKLRSTKPHQSSEKFWAKDLSRIEVKQGKEYTVLPVWVSDENELCVHLVTEASAVEVQKMTRIMTQYCEAGSMPCDIQVGELVCVFLFGDGLWYRAEIINVHSDYVTVDLVDFGNSETILKKNIRGFTSDFMELPSICIRVKLTGISKENVEARRNMQALVKSQLTLNMYSRRETHMEFDLFDPQRKVFLNDELCCFSGRKTADLEKVQKGETGVASPCTSDLVQESKDPSSISSPVIDAIISPSSKEPYKDPSSISSPSVENVKSPPLKKPHPTLGSSTTLHVSSPLLLSTAGQSSTTVDSTNKVESVMPVEMLTSDQSTTAEQRVSTKPPFVDEKQISSVSSITSASPVPLASPNQDCACDLISDDSKTSIITQDTTTALISPTTECSVTSQKCTDPVQDVTSKVPMYDECKTTTLSIADNVTVIVLEALNPHTIFVVPMESLHLYDKLEDMMAAMNEYCNSYQGCLYRPRQGEVCLAKFSQDGKWYRAACINPRQESALVIFVDFANTEMVLHSNILQMPEQFLELPCLALHCILSGVSVNDMKEEASVRVRELLPPYSPTEVDVLKHNEDGTYTIAKPTVTNSLLSEGLVKPE